MPKKCIDCDTEAKFKIKDTSEYYCMDCAEEHFSDLNVLIRLEEDALNLKPSIEESLDEEPSEEDLN